MSKRSNSEPKRESSKKRVGRQQQNDQMVMLGSNAQQKPNRWYQNSGNFRREDDIVSNKLSNRDLLRGISGVASPRSSYHNAYDRNSNNEFNERYGGGQYSAQRRPRGNSFTKSQTLNNLVKEMLLEFFAQKQQEKLNSPKFSPRMLELNSFGGHHNFGLRDSNVLHPASPSIYRGTQFREWLQEQMNQYMHKNQKMCISYPLQSNENRGDFKQIAEKSPKVDNL